MRVTISLLAIAVTLVIPSGALGKSGSTSISTIATEPCFTTMCPTSGLLSPDQAQVAVTSGSVSSGDPATPQVVSPADVSAAMTAPGAVNVGADPTAGGTTTTIDGATTAIKCWSVNSGWTWGTWPYNQHLNSLTYWCAHPGGTVTTISLSPTASSALCSSSASGSLISGGIGFTSFVEQASDSWACPTAIPWITLHTHHWLQTQHNSSGASKQVGEG